MQEHCVTCAGAVTLFQDEKWHHVAPTGLTAPPSHEDELEVVARELDHEAHPCAGRCALWERMTGGRDLHKRHGDEPWLVLADELAELAERGDED